MISVWRRLNHFICWQEGNYEINTCRTSARHQICYWQDDAMIHFLWWTVIWDLYVSTAASDLFWCIFTVFRLETRSELQLLRETLRRGGWDGGRVELRGVEREREKEEGRIRVGACGGWCQRNAWASPLTSWSREDRRPPRFLTNTLTLLLVSSLALCLDPSQTTTESERISMKTHAASPLKPCGMCFLMVDFHLRARLSSVRSCLPASGPAAAAP